jgi:hypothetical protein
MYSAVSIGHVQAIDSQEENPMKAQSSRTLSLLAFGTLMFLPVAGSAQDNIRNSFQVYTHRDHYIRHASFLGRIGRVDTPLDSKDATFRRVRGLASGECTSFEATNPRLRDHYLRHANWRLVLAKRTNDRQFAEDATFCMEYGLINGGRDHSTVSFKSFNFPDRYIRHRNFELWVDPVENTDRFRLDATFLMQPPKLAPVKIDDGTALVPATD